MQHALHGCHVHQAIAEACPRTTFAVYLDQAILLQPLQASRRDMSLLPTFPAHRLRVMRWMPTRAVAAAASAVLALGCAAAAKQAAKSAAPAAVEGAIEEAKEPSTRDAVAEILGDPDIRTSSAALSEAVAKGVVRGVEREMPVEQLQRMTDAVVAQAGASVARTLEHDVAPQLTGAVARVIDESVAHALNEQTEERLRLMVAAVTRATVKGASEALAEVSVSDEDRLNAPSAKLSRNAWYSLGYNGAYGFEHAVKEAHLRQSGGDNSPSILATIGTVADLARGLPLVLLAIGLATIIGLMAALTWALVALKRERSWSRERLVNEAVETKTRGDGVGLNDLARRLAPRGATRHS